MKTKRLTEGKSVVRLSFALASCLLPLAFCLAAEPSKNDDKGKVLAIVGGDVYTITREVIRGGTVLVQDGKILRVGQDLPIPEGATVLDARGKYVTPGFVAVHMAGVGLRAPGAGAGGQPLPGPNRGGRKLADAPEPLHPNIK